MKLVLQNIKVIVWTVLFLIFLFRLKQQSVSYKMFVSYLGLEILVSLADLSSSLPFDKIWLIHTLLYIQSLVLNGFYFTVFTSKRYKKLSIIFSVVLLISWLLTFVPALNISSDIGIYLIVTLMFLMFTTESLMFLYESIQLKRKQFYFFNIGLLVYLISSALVIWLYLLLITILGKSPLFENIYIIVDFICQLVYVLFVVLEFRNYFKHQNTC